MPRIALRGGCRRAASKPGFEKTRGSYVSAGSSKPGFGRPPRATEDGSSPASNLGPRTQNGPAPPSTQERIPSRPHLDLWADPHARRCAGHGLSRTPGVEPGKVMQPVASRLQWDANPSACQFLEDLFRLSGAATEQGPHLLHGDHRGRACSKHSEDPGLNGRELPVAHVERGPDCQVSSLQLVQPLPLVGELGGQCRDGPVSAGGESRVGSQRYEWQAAESRRRRARRGRLRARLGRVPPRRSS